MTAPRPLTLKQRRFVEEYLVDGNATRAARDAGYSAKTAETQGYENLRKPQIAGAIQAAEAARTERLKLTADLVLIRLAELASVDLGEAFDDAGNLKPIKDIPVEVRRAMAGVEVVEIVGRDGEVIGHTKKIKFWDKPKALELIGKSHKLFTDKLQVSGKLTLEQLVAGVDEEEET